MRAAADDGRKPETERVKNPTAAFRLSGVSLAWIEDETL